MTLQSSSWRKKCIMASKSISSRQKLPWRQNVRHDVNKCCIRYDIKKLVASKIRHDVIDTLWCQDVRHYVTKYFMTPRIRHDVRKFALTSKCSSWCKHTSWWQNVRHYFKRFVKKMSSYKKVWHDVKSFVMASKIRQMFVMKSKLRHDVNKFVMKLKHVMTSTN